MYPKVCAMLDKLAKKNVIHKNKAGNLKSKLAKHVNALATKAGVPRNDRHLMGCFKELSEDDQEELVRLRTEHDAKDSPR